jgi:hypothetical protein
MRSCRYSGGQPPEGGYASYVKNMIIENMKTSTISCKSIGGIHLYSILLGL